MDDILEIEFAAEVSVVFRKSDNKIEMRYADEMFAGTALAEWKPASPKYLATSRKLYPELDKWLSN